MTQIFSVIDVSFFTFYVHSCIQALVDICHKVLQAVHKNPSARAVKKGSTVTTDEGSGKKSTQGEKPFDKMNSIVANMLLNLTRLAAIGPYSQPYRYVTVYLPAGPSI